MAVWPDPLLPMLVGTPEPLVRVKTAGVPTPDIPAVTEEAPWLLPAVAVIEATPLELVTALLEARLTPDPVKITVAPEITLP